MSTENSVPVLRFPEFTVQWNAYKLKDLVINLESGVSVNSYDEPIKYGNEYGILKTSCVSSGNFLYQENKRILDEEVSRARLNPLKDSIIISRMNTPELVGESGYVKEDHFSLFIPDRLWRATTDNSKINPKLLSLILASPKFKRMLSDIATGTSSSMKNISKPNFLNLSITVPTLPEQKKIAAFFASVDEKIQQLSKKKELLEQYKKGVIQKIFNQEIRFKDDNGDNFTDWEEKKGNEIFDSVSNKNHNSDLPILAITQDYGAIPRDQIDYQISVTDKSVESYKVVEVGDFIISLRSFQGGIEYSNYKGICSPAYIILRSKVTINNVFYKYYLKTDYYIQQLNKKLEGIRDGKMVSYKYFSDISLPYPSLEEQNKIADFFTSIDEKINLVNEQLERAKEYKKGLLQKMFI